MNANYEDHDICFASYNEYMKAMWDYPLGTYDVALPGGRARYIDIEETIQMVFNHPIHYEELKHAGILKLDGTTTRINPDVLHVRFSCDGAEMNKSKSVITLSMTLIGFGALIHSPVFNIPVAHVEGSESDLKMLRLKFTRVYEDISNLQGAVLKLKLPDGLDFYGKVHVLHVYDLKYAYNIVGHSLWTSDYFPHLFCHCMFLKCHHHYHTYVQRNGEPAPCQRLTNVEYKQLLNKAKIIRKEIQHEFNNTSVQEQEQMFKERVRTENFGINDKGALGHLLDIDTMYAEPLHCYLGLSTQHMKWLRHLRAQYGISEVDFYTRMFSVVTKYAPSTQKLISDEAHTPAFIGRVCNVFWDHISVHGAKQLFKTIFKDSVNSVDIKQTIKMFDKFEKCRAEITCTWTSKANIEAFKRNVKIWYNLACKTMWVSKGKETVYAHILANVIPLDLEAWFQTSKHGYGVFSMQGTEHLNKVTKNLLRGHTNNQFDKERVHGGPPNDCFVTILRLSRWKFFVQHHVVHTTKLLREETIKKEELVPEHDVDIFIHQHIKH